LAVCSVDYSVESWGDSLADPMVDWMAWPVVACWAVLRGCVLVGWRDVPVAAWMVDCLVASWAEMMAVLMVAQTVDLWVSSLAATLAALSAVMTVG
jgi:hypothetical protein